MKARNSGQAPAADACGPKEIADECEAIETFLADSLARPDSSERPYLRSAPTMVLLVRSD
jgi:hypothetical protein